MAELYYSMVESTTQPSPLPSAVPPTLPPSPPPSFESRYESMNSVLLNGSTGDAETVLRNTPLTRGIFNTYFTLVIKYITIISFMEISLIAIFEIIDLTLKRWLLVPFFIVCSLILALLYKGMMEHSSPSNIYSS